MRSATSLFVTLLLLFCIERSARADRWAIVPAAAPSTAHPKGTVLVFGEATVERDVATGKALRSAPFASPFQGISATVANGETFVATDAADDVALLVIGNDLKSRERVVLGKGSNPTLVAGGPWLAIGFYELRPPAKTFANWAPQYVYRVLLLDRASRKVIAQKLYGEPSNLCPQLNVEDGMLAFHDGRLFVSLPLPHKAHLVAASLPSLATVAETDLAHDALMGSMRIAWSSDRLVAVGPKWIELSSDLKVLAERPWSSMPAPIRVAIDGAAVLLDGAPPTGIASTHRATEPEHMAWAWGNPLALRHHDDDPEAPVELVVVP